MSEGAADRAEQSRSMKRNEKELPTTRTAQPRRPISQYQSLPRPQTRRIRHRRSINLADDQPPPSSARGRHHHPQNGADRFQHLPINTDRFHVRNQRSRIRRRRTERHRTSHHRRRRPTGRPLHREEADQHHKDRTRESKAISKEVHTLIKGASQSL